jgi:hypothetical protein
MQRIYRLVHSRFRVLGWTLALFRWPRVHSGGGLLALSYRISQDTIHKHIKRAAVPLHERGLTDEQKTEAERPYLSGWSLQRLADRYGKDDETIRRIARSGGPHARPVGAKIILSNLEVRLG